MPSGVQVLVGRIKYRLIEQLALDEVTQAKLAEEYGVSTPAITAFARRNKAAIEKRREELASEIQDEFAGNWIANKALRLEEAAAIFEEVGPSAGDPKVGRLKLDLMRYASEELGQLPSRQVPPPSTAGVVYQVEGVDPEDVT